MPTLRPLFVLIASSVFTFAACGGETLEKIATDAGTDAKTDSSAKDAGTPDTAICTPPAAATAGPGGALTYGTCPASPTCGGDLDGTSWTFESGCSTDVTQQILSVCPTTTINSTTGSLKGTVSFGCGKMVRTGATTAVADVTIPLSCTRNIPCAQLTSQIGLLLPGASGTCTTNQAATACDCTINVVTDLAATASYTATAGSVTSGVGNFEYCVEAGKFTQTFGDATKIHGLFTATKL